ncbi:MAG TPA: hypothetical protein VKO18_02390 [Terriglobia bacterium]|nr:hypothetical protein [Terriglobia bacterium]
MKSNSNLAKKILVGVALLMVAGLLSLATAADLPLSQDDITLLLLGSSPSSKIIQMVEKRGVDFQMKPDLAKKFHDQGAGDDLIDALQKAGNKAAAAKVSAPAPAPENAPAPASTPPAAPAAAPSPSAESNSNTPAAPAPSLGRKPNAVGAPEPRAAEAPPAAPTPAVAPSSSEPVLHTRQSSAPVATTAASAPSPAPASAGAGSSSEPVLHESAKKEAPPEAPAIANAPGLKDPDTPGIQHIIQEFAAKEKVFREARNNYTYHQINKVQEFAGNGSTEIVGTFEQEWDILYDDSGKRIERVTYAPLNTLKGLIITKEDLEGFRNITPFVLTTDELPDYDIKYLGHVKVDQITAYVFSTRPKEIQKNRQYFQGIVWVDDRDLQIVKSEGKQVPQAKSHGGENLFPRFTTWREQVDGKFWFPTYTMGDDTLYFSNATPIHMKEIVRYTDYKQFKSGVRILTVESIDKKDQVTPAATPPKK